MSKEAKIKPYTAGEAYKVSPSLIGMLLECPRCLWLYYRENIVRPRGLFPSLPGGMDGILKDYFDYYRERNELPPEIGGQITDAKLYREDMNKFNVWRDIDFGRGGLSAEFPEYGIILKGAIDELLVSDRGEYIPFDFKTRGYPTKEDSHKHYQHQLDLYALLFEKNNLPPAEVGYLLFFWPKEYKDRSTRFETQLVKMSVSAENGRAILKRTQEIIQGPQPASHAKCEFCLYREAGKSAT